MNVLGQELKRFRMQAQLSQREMALAMGVTLRTVQNIEYGTHMPTKTTRANYYRVRKRYKEVLAKRPAMVTATKRNLIGWSA
jgi:transcriptional regulator with XRE-family HTH domain